jgi:hypothetical protein
MASSRKTGDPDRPSLNITIELPSPKAGRKRKKKMLVQLPMGDYEKLQELAREQEETPSSMARVCIQLVLKGWEESVREQRQGGAG